MRENNDHLFGRGLVGQFKTFTFWKVYPGERIHKFSKYVDMKLSNIIFYAWWLNYVAPHYFEFKWSLKFQG